MKRLTLLLLLLASVGLGCKLIETIRSGGASGGPGIGYGSDPRADVVAASKKFTELKFFSAKTEGVGQTEIKSQIDYVAPDRFHIKYLVGTGAGMEMIMIGNQTFMKTGNSWSKMPGEGNASIPTLRDSFTEEGLKTLTDAKFEGTDTLDGKETLIYSYKNVTPKGDFPFTCKMWVGKESGLPMRIFAEYSNGVLKNMTINYDTETPVSIEPPIK